jgi:hypothetical protein
MQQRPSGQYYPGDGPRVSFGPEDSTPTLSELLNADQNSTTGEGPFGWYDIDGGTQSGHIGNTSFENFERILFTVVEA